MWLYHRAWAEGKSPKTPTIMGGPIYRSHPKYQWGVKDSTIAKNED
jgi:hypothetical protein